ncbi:MAG: hypothetical protein ACTMIK_11255 [Galactobacter sp.]
MITYKPCITCHQLVRPHGANAEQHPGTVRFGGLGECNTCRGRTLAKANDPINILHATLALRDYLTGRRQRLARVAA